jgi:hypothetical protein
VFTRRRAQEAEAPLEKVQGLLQIAWMINLDEAAQLGRDVLQRIPSIGNIYIATELLADVLPLAIATNDTRFVTNVITRLVEEGGSRLWLL